MPNWKTLRQQSKKSPNAAYQNRSIWKLNQMQNICCRAIIKIHSCITDLVCNGLHSLKIYAEVGGKEPHPNKRRQAKKSSPCDNGIKTDMSSTSSWNAAMFLNTGQSFAAILAIISTLPAGLDAAAVTHLGYHHAAWEIPLWTTVCSMLECYSSSQKLFWGTYRCQDALLLLQTVQVEQTGATHLSKILFTVGTDERVGS